MFKSLVIQVTLNDELNKVASKQSLYQNGRLKTALFFKRVYVEKRNKCVMQNKNCKTFFTQK